MYIVNRGTALYAGRPVHAGATWGEDILLDRPDLRSTSAVATSYLWVYTLDAMRPKAAIKKFPGSAELLAGVRQKWILRRAVVRHAEYEMHRRGMHFRGRFYPIYAKAIKERLITRQEHRADRCGADLQARPHVSHRPPLDLDALKHEAEPSGGHEPGALVAAPSCPDRGGLTRHPWRALACSSDSQIGPEDGARRALEDAVLADPRRRPRILGRSCGRSSSS